MRIELRPVKNTDLRFLLDLRKKMMSRYTSEMSQEDSSSDLERIMHAFDDIKIILFHGEEAGMIKMSKNQSDKVWYIYQVQIEPRFQGLGIGKSILTDICDAALKSNVAVGLGVFKSNPAISLYKNLGFKPVTSSEHEIEMIFNA